MSSPEVQLPDMDALLSVIRQMVGEVHPHWKNLHFQPDTHLERELGLDSMARIELHDRIERELRVVLPDKSAIQAVTAGEIMRALELHARGATFTPADNDRGHASDLLMGNFGQADNTSPGTDGRNLLDRVYGIYAWLVFVPLALLAFTLLLVIPFAGARRKAGHWCARALFVLTFTPLEISGREHLDPRATRIIAANHASYLDGFIITAALDLPIHFIVKGELASIAPVRIILQRFGVEFVDRFNASRGSSDVGRIAAKAGRGQSIVFFPEGTFTSFAGLQPFRMGAFVTAARAGVAVQPVAIRGARAIVRGDDWLPRRGRLAVTVCAPITPEPDGWQTALQLRDATRAALAPHTGEPDLVPD